MEHATQVRLIEKVLGLLGAASTDMVEQEHCQSVEAYTHPARLQREINALYRRQPLIVCRTDDIPGPGDFLTQDHYGLPLLVTRDHAGKVHVQFNVCRHRGTRLVDEPRGTRKVFVCPYHAWNYDCAGRLIRITDEEGFPALDKTRSGLVQLPAIERHGFVWSVLTPEATLTEKGLRGWLGPLDDDFRGFGLAGHASYRPLSQRLEMNWKLAFDIFLEAYHLRYVHRRSIYPMFFDNIAVFERFAPHMRNLFPKRDIETLRGSDSGGWDIRPHSNILYTIFPNTLVLVLPDHLSLFHVYPQGTSACIIYAYALLPQAPDSEKAAKYWDMNLDILHTAIAEDIVMGESIQRGLASGANTHMNFGRYEQSLAWFHESVEDALEDATPLEHGGHEARSIAG